MNSESSVHVADELLLGLLDGELSDEVAGNVHRHADGCDICLRRIDDFRSAAAAFGDYEQRIVRASLAKAPVSWPTLEPRLTEIDRRITPTGFRRFPIAYPLAMAAGILIGVILTMPAPKPVMTAGEVLERSVKAPVTPRRQLRVRAFGQALLRPAVLSDNADSQDDNRLADKVNALFVAAHYDWNDPLSAKAYLAWRKQLGRHHDEVSLIGEPTSAARVYRVRTDTDSSVLRTALLTVRAADMQPVEGAFDFGSAGTIEISDDGPGPAATTSDPPRKSPALPRPHTDKTEVLSPEDALHVLAALNRAGADVGQPLELTNDTSGQKLIVIGAGLSGELQRRIRQELAALPKVELRVEQPAGPGQGGMESGAAPQSSAEMPPAIRTMLEERLGGPLALEAVTEEVLDASGVILARAYALEVLARWVPRDAEARLSLNDHRLLDSLRQQHRSSIAQLTARIEQKLRPILGESSRATEAPNPRLMDAARELNRRLSVFLAGTYGQPQGEAMIRDLRRNLDDLGRALRVDSNEGR